MSPPPRTLHPQARPLPGHEGHEEVFRSKLQPTSLRGPASNRTQKSPPSLRKERGQGDRQAQVGLPQRPPLGMEGAPPKGAFQERATVRVELQVDRGGRKAVGAVVSLGSELPPHLSSLQAAVDPKRSSLTPHLRTLRELQPLSCTYTFLPPCPGSGGLCGFLEAGSSWGGWMPVVVPYTTDF